VDGVLLVGIGLVAGALAVVAPWPVAFAAAGAALTARAARGAGRTVGAAWLVAAVVALGAGWWRARGTVDGHEGALAGARAVLASPARCRGRAVVVTSPVRTHGVARWDAAVRDAECDVERDDATASERDDWTGRATLYGGPDDLARGDEVDIVAQLAPPERFWNDATGDPRPAAARRGVLRTGGAIDVRVTRRARGVLAWIDRARARVRARIDATFPGDTAPMARALVLGESDLAAEDDAAFRGSGLSHLLAVSGMHLVLVVAGVVAALKGALVRVERLAARVEVGRIAAAIGVPIAWGYASFAGAGGSTLRAAWMMTAALAARAMGRRSDGVRALALSLAAMALVDPLVAFDMSFALSAAATAGLLGLARPISDALAARLPSRLTVLGPLTRSVGVTLAATLPCAPLLACFAPTVALGGLAANLLAVPLGESAALPLCLLHALLGAFPAAERGCALAGGGALVAVRAIARAFGAVPALGVPIPPPSAWQLATLAIATIAWAARGRLRAHAVALTAAALLVLELAARRGGRPTGALRATFLDVGQGDAALVDLPGGGAILIDGGGFVGSPIDTGARVIAPTLRARRRDALDAVVLSHPHPDHFGGLATGTARLRIGALWDTGQGEREGTAGAYAALLAAARARAVPIVHPDALCGARELSGARVEVLAPCPAPWPDRGANDNSLVLRLSFGRRAFLFMGDAEHEEESDLLRLPPGALRADVLKVGHHGSRTSSSPGFLAAVGATHAVVSTGVRNRFGHPHPSTLATLGAAGLRVWRTDLHGAVTAWTDGERLEVHAAAGIPLHPPVERATNAP
jgi:competence protein ComEC